MSENKAFQEFAFNRQNYIYLVVGIVIIIIGFLVMSGGGSDDPNVFKGDYTLTEESFEKLTSQFDVSEEVKEKLMPLKDKVYPSELELKAAMIDILGQQTLDKNYYQLRAATDIDADMFNTRRLTIAPIIVLFGYAFIMYAIMKKGENQPSIEEEVVEL